MSFSPLFLRGEALRSGLRAAKLRLDGKSLEAKVEELKRDACMVRLMGRWPGVDPADNPYGASGAPG